MNTRAIETSRLTTILYKIYKGNCGINAPNLIQINHNHRKLAASCAHNHVRKILRERICTHGTSRWQRYTHKYTLRHTRVYENDSVKRNITMREKKTNQQKRLSWLKTTHIIWAGPRNKKDCRCAERRKNLSNKSTKQKLHDNNNNKNRNNPPFRFDIGISNRLANNANRDTNSNSVKCSAVHLFVCVCVTVRPV